MEKFFMTVLAVFFLLVLLVSLLLQDVYMLASRTIRYINPVKKE